MDSYQPVNTDQQVNADQQRITDQQLLQGILAEFRNNRVLHFVKLNVHVEDGIVTISGRVNSFAERNAVERAARRVAGIKNLVLEIRAAAIPITVTRI